MRKLFLCLLLLAFCFFTCTYRQKAEEETSSHLYQRKIEKIDREASDEWLRVCKKYLLHISARVKTNARIDSINFSGWDELKKNLHRQASNVQLELWIFEKLTDRNKDCLALQILKALEEFGAELDKKRLDVFLYWNEARNVSLNDELFEQAKTDQFSEDCIFSASSLMESLKNKSDLLNKIRYQPMNRQDRQQRKMVKEQVEIFILKQIKKKYFFDFDKYMEVRTEGGQVDELCYEIPFCRPHPLVKEYKECFGSFEGKIQCRYDRINGRINLIRLIPPYRKE